MSTPVRIVAVAAVLAGVFAFGYVIASREDRSPARELDRAPLPVAAEPADVASSELDAPAAHDRASTQDPVAVAPQGADPAAAKRTVIRETSTLYANAPREWKKAYGSAIKAVRNPELNPDGRELDEACLKQLEPIVKSGVKHIQELEQAEIKALDTFMEWKVSQGLVVDTTKKQVGLEGRRFRSTRRSQNGKVTVASVIIDPGESPEVDAATRDLEDGRMRYEREVREFIASCGR